MICQQICRQETLAGSRLYCIRVYALPQLFADVCAAHCVLLALSLLLAALLTGQRQ